VTGQLYGRIKTPSRWNHKRLKSPKRSVTLKYLFYPSGSTSKKNKDASHGLGIGGKRKGKKRWSQKHPIKWGRDPKRWAPWSKTGGAWFENPQVNVKRRNGEGLNMQLDQSTTWSSRGGCTGGLQPAVKKD